MQCHQGALEQEPNLCNEATQCQSDYRCTWQHPGVKYVTECDEALIRWKKWQKKWKSNKCVILGECICWLENPVSVWYRVVKCWNSHVSGKWGLWLTSASRSHQSVSSDTLMSRNCKNAMHFIVLSCTITSHIHTGSHTNSEIWPIQHKRKRLIVSAIILTLAHLC